MIGNLLCAIGQALGGGCNTASIIKPGITFYEADASAVMQALANDGITLLRSPLDKVYYYTTEWGWKQAIDYIRKVYTFPPYTAEKMDCDDFAFLMKGLLSSEFGLTACCFIIGNSGKHAFNMVLFPEEWKDLEPQTGGLGEDYKAEKALV